MFRKYQTIYFIAHGFKRERDIAIKLESVREKAEKIYEWTLSVSFIKKWNGFWCKDVKHVILDFS